MFEDEYSEQKLRTTSSNSKLDYRTLSPLWSLAEQDSLGAGVIATIAPLDMTDFDLPFSSTLDKEDIATLGGLVSFPLLCHLYRLSDQQEELYITILQPSKMWLQAHPDTKSLNSSVVPDDFEGELEFYSLDRKFIKGYVFRAGLCISAYIPQEGETLRDIECHWVLSGYSFRYYNTIESGQAVAIAERIPQWALNCVTSFPKTYQIEDVWGSGAYPSPQDLKKVIDENLWGSLPEKLKEYTEFDMAQKLEKMCEELKRIMQDPNNKLNEKIAELRKYRDTTDAQILVEKGWAELSDGTFKELTSNDDAHSLSLDGIVSDELYKTGIRLKGMLHNHTKPIKYKDDYIKRPIQVYSPEDIIQFFSTLFKSSRQGAKVVPQDVYSALVAEDYTYILRYNLGVEYLQHSQVAMGTPIDSLLKKEYSESWVDLSTSNLLEEIYKYLCSVYPLDGLSIHRIDKDKNIKSMLIHQLDRPESWDPNRKVSDFKITQISKDC